MRAVAAFPRTREVRVIETPEPGPVVVEQDEYLIPVHRELADAHRCDVEEPAALITAARGGSEQVVHLADGSTS